MTEVTRITIPVSADEVAALRQAADRDFRHPRDQARFLLRYALGLPTETPPALARNEGAQLLSIPVASSHA